MLLVHRNVLRRYLSCDSSREICHSCSFVLKAHSSVERAGLLSAVKVRKVTTDNEYAMRGSDLEQAIKEDLDKGLIPFFVRK